MIYYSPTPNLDFFTTLTLSRDIHHYYIESHHTIARRRRLGHPLLTYYILLLSKHEEAFVTHNFFSLLTESVKTNSCEHERIQKTNAWTYTWFGIRIWRSNQQNLVSLFSRVFVASTGSKQRPKHSFISNEKEKKNSKHHQMKETWNVSSITLPVQNKKTKQEQELYGCSNALRSDKLIENAKTLPLHAGGDWEDPWPLTEKVKKTVI